MANQPLPGEQPGQIDALLERWQVSLDLHARYAALDDTRYRQVQPWPEHARPQRWIIQLARKRILALRRIVSQRHAEGDRAFIEGVEIMGFLATLMGLTSAERHIPLATHEAERREVLSARPQAAAAKSTADTTRSRGGEPRRGAPAAAAAQSAPQPRREPRHDTQRSVALKPRRAPANITQAEHVVIADAVRLLGWGQQWHELAEKVARLSERPAPSEIRRILRTYRAHIDAIVKRRAD